MAEVNYREARGRHRIASIQPLGEHRIFTLEEALELFSLVRRITAASAAELEPISVRLREPFSFNDEITVLEKEYERIVRRWVAKMERLGLVVKGLWLVDFDTGDGYLCWKFPELELGHYHPYDKGFSGRHPLAEVLAVELPDWA